MTTPPITSLETMGYADLQALWTHLGLPPLQQRISVDILRHLLADALQKAQQPDIPTEAAIRRTLERSITKASSKPVLHAQPGTVLTRDWKGMRHTVQVLEDGYDWQGSTYNSLSKIAHLITGTRWSGPRFFGVQV